MTKTVSFITENFDKYDPSSLDSYLSIGGFAATKKVIDKPNEFVIGELEKSGIQGRGGAAYGTALKWQQAAEVEGEQKIVICNADEGEPCTFKDREILKKDPFRLIEGMTICAHTVGAQRGYIYIREEYRFLQPAIKDAIEQCKKANLLGNNILGSDFSFDIFVYSGAGAYVCGEGSTLIESIEGKSGRPRIKPPYIKQCGLWQLPTCVNNVETLTAACAIIQNGAESFAKYGTPDSPGTKLICLGGNIKNHGVYEIPFGLTLREIVEDIGGGIKGGYALQFIQLGGASGRIISSSGLDTVYSYDGLRKAKLVVGSGGFLVVDERTDILEFLRHVQDFFVHESCGKCTPCREGNRQIQNILHSMLDNTADIEQIETAKRFANIMASCSFCGLGETAQSAFLSALDHFPNAFLGKGV